MSYRTEWWRRVTIRPYRVKIIPYFSPRFSPEFSTCLVRNKIRRVEGAKNRKTDGDPVDRAVIGRRNRADMFEVISWSCFFLLIRICIDADETRANNGVNYPNYCLEKQRAFDSTGFKAYKELMVCKLSPFTSSHRLTRWLRSREKRGFQCLRVSPWKLGTTTNDEVSSKRVWIYGNRRTNGVTSARIICKCKCK